MRSRTAPPDEFLDRDGAADLAHQSVRTIDRWLKLPEGAPPSFKIGRHVLIPRAEFIAWLRSRGGQS
jgi:Helix-turn-helix domain